MDTVAEEEATMSSGPVMYTTLSRRNKLNRIPDPKRRSSWLKRIPTRCEIQLNNVTKPQDVEDVLFELLGDKTERVSILKFWSALKSTGLRPNDPRLQECFKQFQAVREHAGKPDDDDDLFIDRATFKRCVTENIFLVNRAFKKDLVIPEFHTFSQEIENIFTKCKDNGSGKLAVTIPQLARISPHRWGVAVCTIDGQRLAFGDTDIPFVLQACSMPLNYALALSDKGTKDVHRHVGFEPSGGSYNEISLNLDRIPHNPMINAGALVTVSLLRPDLRLADRFEYLLKQYREMAGGEKMGYNNAVYLSEKSTSDRNFSIAYYLRENNCFPKHTDLQETLELFIQLQSVEVTAKSASVMAATLANGGICPITGHRVLCADAVRNTLSLMHSCGLNSYSGQFAFKVGLPAKSGLSGMLMLIVPRVMGVCCWSPLLDEQTNSIRAIQFCEMLVKTFNFHNYDMIRMELGSEARIDPCKRKFVTEAKSVVNFLFGASNGDCTAVRRFALSGMNMEAQDYDGRTALHVAAANGHLGIIKMLIEQLHVKTRPKDRWGRTPLDDARRFSHPDIVAYLEKRETSGVKNEKN